MIICFTDWDSCLDHFLIVISSTAYSFSSLRIHIFQTMNERNGTNFLSAYSVICFVNYYSGLLHHNILRLNANHLYRLLTLQFPFQFKRLFVPSKKKRHFSYTSEWFADLSVFAVDTVKKFLRISIRDSSNSSSATMMELYINLFYFFQSVKLIVFVCRFINVLSTAFTLRRWRNVTWNWIG